MQRFVWRFVCLTLASGAIAASAQSEPTEAQLRRAVTLHSSALADMEALNLGRAISTLEQLEQLLPNNVLPKINLAICHFRLNQGDEALELLEQARQIDGGNPQALFAVARILGGQVADDIEARRAWDAALRRMLSLDRNDPRPYFLRARSMLDRERWADAGSVLAEAVRRNPDNLVLLVDRLVAAAQAGAFETAADALDGVEDRLNGFSAQQEEYSEALRDAVFEESETALKPPALILQNLLRPSELYQVGLAELQGREGGLFLFPQLEFWPALPKSIQGGEDLEIAFERQAMAPWEQLEGVRELILERRLGSEPVLARRTDGRIFRVTAGQATETGLASDGPVLAFDMDQDAKTDLVITSGTAVRLHSDFAGVTAANSTADSGVQLLQTDKPATLLVATDGEQDGDLDLLVGAQGEPHRLLRNEGGDGFQDVTPSFGLGTSQLTAAASIDLENDGDLDLIASTSEGLQVFINRRSGPLVDDTDTWFGDTSSAAESLLVLDLEGDGDLDVLALGSPLRALRNEGRSFAEEPTSFAVTNGQLADLDNDGDLDLVGTGTGAKLVVLRNREGTLEAMPGVPETSDSPGIRQALAHDADDDGDLDLLLVQLDGRVAALKNEGGNRNHWVRLSLEGRNDSNAKNNTQGLFARIELRVGAGLETLIGNGGVNHLGLGARRQADVIRVTWTNGLTQTWQQVAAEQTLIEKQVLKGSCPFLYTWTGAEFSFHTDLMWRSTLGMVFPDGTAAPHQPARDYVLIPEAALQPAGDELWLQVTDELWETIYVDEQKLLVADVPEGAELIVDESFGPPPFPESPPVILATDLIAPTAARDHLGNDVLDLLLARDGHHVEELPRTRYQGVTDLHTLELSFPPVPGQLPEHLVLWGWIFPADTTINVALAQDSTRNPTPPWIELLTAGGESFGTLPLRFPNGKKKAVVIDLQVESAPQQLVSALRNGLTLRLQSHHELYWDRAALATTRPAPSSFLTLVPHAADLHYRGFSTMNPRRHGEPHTFDYAELLTHKVFPPMAGKHTRYGSVIQLVREADDRYVIMSPGDELTLRYPTPPPTGAGLVRSYILFTDGWVKDADLHTKSSQTVHPLPYRGMNRYPEMPHQPPDSEEDRETKRRFQTREMQPGQPQR